MFLKRKKHFPIIFLFPVFLSGCVSLRLPQQPQRHFNTISPAKRQAALSKIKRWTIEGAFSVQHNGKASIANYTWQQQGLRRYRISIRSALDLYNIYIVGMPHRVRLWKSATTYFQAATPERLMQRAVGWSLPISSLYYWVRGLPAPNAMRFHFDRYGHLVFLQQQGWKIYLTHYITVGPVDLPQRLLLERQNLTVTLVIKRWNFSSQ